MTRKLIFAMALLILVGCQKESIQRTYDNRPNPDGSIGFSLNIHDAEINTDDNSQTKGIPNKSLDKYSIVYANAYSHTLDYDVTTDNDIKLFREIELTQETPPDWKYNPSMFWPVGKMLSFMVYASDIPFDDAGISFSPSEGAPDIITYKVPSEVAKQPDLLVSTKYNQSQTDNISLTMRHALSCVSFCGIAPDPKTYVRKITLRNVCREGTLALNSSAIAWEAKLESKVLTIFEPGIYDDQELGKDPLSDNSYLMKEDGYLMMIPQKLTNTAAIDVHYWNGKDDTENKVITYTLPIDNEEYATWKPGQKYIYKFGNQSKEDITVVYYEKYADSKYGLYYNNDGTMQNSLEDKVIEEAGYGVITKSDMGTNLPIRLATNSAPSAISGSVVELTGISSFLYPVSQSAASTFTLTASTIPLDVYFNNSDRSCGMIVPHFAKGVYSAKTATKTHAIRTPQQMRNITQLGVSSSRKTYTYNQELNLDFSKESIGGGNLDTPVVNCQFNDLFDGKKKRIENVKINSSNVNGALFLSNRGEINDVLLVNSSIVSSGNTGGIVATNESSGEIIHPRIIGENDSDKKFEVQGSLYVGSIAGENHGKIIGNIEIENATELPVAEVSGWVSIRGSGQPVGGVVGINYGTLTTCLLNGVYVTGNIKGDVKPAKISIEGGNYVGGIVGVNWARVDGNYSGSGSTMQAEPDVAGIVSISGNDFVGGIAGQNSGSGVLNQVNLRLGRGDATLAITITGKASVGGIAGFNTEGGTLKADGNSFISVRGNVNINGTENVGGIVGNNQSGNISNCFVYNFYSQTPPLIHHAPKITGANRVGGIVGYAGTGIIKNCAVFSTVSATNVTDGGDATNAIAKIKATGSSVGGIVGRGFRGLEITTSYVLGNVNIEGNNNSGGIVGENDPGTTIKSVHVGNSGIEVSNVYENLFKLVKLPVTDPRMQTGGSVMTYKSGTPTILGGMYLGGICGVNWGTVDGIAIKDNIKIGTSSSSFVGGIAGGNGPDATVKNCKTYNPTIENTTVLIEGTNQVGGIVGLNNGIVEACDLGMKGLGKSRLITIKGIELVGGIAGINGGNENCMSGGLLGTGNDNTRIENCNVYGKVLIEATEIDGPTPGEKRGGYRVGGIIGQNGPTNKVIGCNVIGYESSYNNNTSFSYDITLRGKGSIGGIAGSNYGDIHGSLDSYSKVTHTAVIGSDMFAGGLVGDLKSRRTKTDADYPFESKLYYCDVSQGVLIHYYNNAAGAFAGRIDGEGAKIDAPILYGTSPVGATNKIYTGSDNPVRISANNDSFIQPPPINSMPVIPPNDPRKTGNLWAGYVLYNYLYWTTYK